MKKPIIALLIMICAAFSSCLADNLYINIGAYAFVLNDAYEVIQASEPISRAVPLGDTGLNALKYASNGLCAIADANFIPISEAVYEDFRLCADRLLLKRQGLWAIYDHELNELSEFTYTAIIEVGEHFFALQGNITDDDPDALYILDRDGNEMPTNTLLWYSDTRYSQGLVAAHSASYAGWGYLDEEGSWLIAPEFMWAGSFIDSLAPVSLLSGSGVIDPQGEWILSPHYSFMSLDEDYIICGEHGNLYVYSRDSEGLKLILVETNAHAASLGEYFALYKPDYVRLMDKQGEIRAEFSADTLLYAGLENQVIAADSNGMYVYDISSNQLYGFFEHVQALTGDNFYRYAELNSDGDYVFGAMSQNGDLLTEAIYQNINSPAAGYLAALAGDEIRLFKVTDSEATDLRSIPLYQD